MVELGDENQPHVIRATLPRRTCFSRKMPGNSSQAQVIGANIDYVAVVTDAGPDFNIRPMERYFMLIGRSGAKAVVLIDNPGMREIQMWTDEATLRDSFADVDALTADCKFSDCSHRTDIKITGEMKMAAKVTVQSTMIATTIEVKPDKPEKKKAVLPPALKSDPIPI